MLMETPQSPAPAENEATLSPSADAADGQNGDLSRDLSRQRLLRVLAVLRGEPLIAMERQESKRDAILRSEIGRAEIESDADDGQA